MYNFLKILIILLPLTFTIYACEEKKEEDTTSPNLPTETATPYDLDISNSGATVINNDILFDLNIVDKQGSLVNIDPTALIYNWAVTPQENAVVVDNNTATPKIKFKSRGNYNITATVTDFNGEKVASASKNIKVYYQELPTVFINIKHDTPKKDNVTLIATIENFDSKDINVDYTYKIYLGSKLVNTIAEEKKILTQGVTTLSTDIDFSGKETGVYTIELFIESGIMYRDFVGKIAIGDTDKYLGIIGGDHALLINKDIGSYYAWGNNSSGQLGFNADKITTRPPKLKIQPFKSINIKDINTLSAIETTSYALLDNGSLYAWGSNFYGQLSTDDRIDSSEPLPAKNEDGTIISNIKSFSAGGDRGNDLNYAVFTILNDGSLYSWGRNGDGVLGTMPSANYTYYLLKQVLGEGGVGFLQNVKYITNHAERAYAITEDSSMLYAWGKNIVSFGDLGTGTTVATNPIPTSVKGADGTPIKGVSSIAIGNFNTLVLMNNGTLYAWGRNSDGQLGIGKNSTELEQTFTPMVVLNPEGTAPLSGIKEIYGYNGINNLSALSEDGVLYNWGNKQTGLFQNTSSGLLPTKIDLPSTINKFVKVFNKHPYIYMAQGDDGNIYIWGQKSKKTISVLNMDIEGSYLYPPAKLYFNLENLK